ncbi:hypothetical protein IWQ57_003389 [Coemansia nantahalensis]|uniref:Uncharacterized protein n=2 Tax=Coemansia TaxID=4863 RepID=A0ACC1JX44_9FUNG|nr:hypothetical protein IWQ57_003389 [Coemansia nantahalensis]
MAREETGAAVDTRLDTLSAQAVQVRELVDKLRERVESGELATGNGLSFLEVKHQTMLSYISHLSYVVLRKLHGRPIAGHPAIERLVEERTVIEKMKPLEQRLKYQVDKLLRNAVVGDQPAPPLATTDDPEKAPVDAKLEGVLSEDPSAFRPNPADLEVDVREEDVEAIGSGVYRAPKQMPVHYEEEGSEAARREKTEKRLMDRAARSRLVRDLMEEYDDRPETATASGNSSVAIRDGRMERLAAERQRYEEDNFTRLNTSKKDRRAMLPEMAGLDDEFAHLNDFAGLAALRKTTGAAASKAAVLERIKTKKRDNQSQAEKDMRRRHDRADDSDDGFSARAAHRPKRSKFQTAKRRLKR